MWCFQIQIGNQDHADLKACFDFPDVGALFVQQEGCDIHWNLRVNRRGVFLHRLFLDQTHDVQRSRFRAANMAGTVATWAYRMAGFAQAGLQALAR